MWILFTTPFPTPDGQSAEDLYRKRLTWITAEMQESAREFGCSFLRAWFAANGSALYALARWETQEGATAFFQQWNIEDEQGEFATTLLGDVGLVPES